MQKRQIVYGVRAIQEAIKANKPIDKVLIEDGHRSSLISETIGLLKSENIPYQFVPSQAFHKYIKDGENHQGMIAFVSPVDFQELEPIIEKLIEDKKMPLILIMDRITDTRNFGAIARSAECHGVHAIVIPSRGSAAITEDAIKTSAGALFKIPICREENLKGTIELIKSYGITVVACTEKTKHLLPNTDLKKPLAIMMGSEDEGVAPEYLKRCDLLCKIPMVGTIESLNVSVAAGIILYEVLKQRMD